jgi:hypothetical protein
MANQTHSIVVKADVEGFDTLVVLAHNAGALVPLEAARILRQR